jgi:osmotically-inducible protein OsmY
MSPIERRCTKLDSKGCFTTSVGGHVPSHGDKSQAESTAKSIAGGQVVANQIGVIPPPARELSLTSAGAKIPGHVTDAIHRTGT